MSKVFVIGGRSMYELFFDKADFLHITNNEIHLSHHGNITENSLNINHKITLEIWPFVLLFILFEFFLIRLYS